MATLPDLDRSPDIDWDEDSNIPESVIDILREQAGDGESCVLCKPDEFEDE